MNTITLNTLTGAVSEYTRHAFQSVTPTHGGNATGLYAFGGDTDDGLPIVAHIQLPGTLRESTLKKAIKMAYISMRGAGSARFTVHGAQQSWGYDFPVRPSGQSRCQVARASRRTIWASV